MSDDVLYAQLKSLPIEEITKLEWRSRWLAEARPKQIIDFSILEEDTVFIHSGRGFGKTRTLAEWISWELCNRPGAFGHLIAPTHNDIRYVDFEGESGIINIVPEMLIHDYNKTDAVITFYNGAILRGFTAEEPERLRGPQCQFLALDEIATWGRDEETYRQARFGHRLGRRSTCLIVSTPKPRDLVKKLFQNKRIKKIGGSMRENEANLSANFIEEMEQLAGTRLGRQELAGELLDAEEVGVIKRSQWRMWPNTKPLPEFEIIIASIDSAFTEESIDFKKRGASEEERADSADFTACSVWGGVREPLNKEEIEQVNLLYGKDESVVRRVISRGKPKIILLDCWAERLGFPDLVTKLTKLRDARFGQDEVVPEIKPLFGSKRLMGQGRKPDLILIEDKGSGISLRQTLRRFAIPVVPYNPKRADKLLRLNLCSPLFVSGYVYAPQTGLKDEWGETPQEFKVWAEPLIGQICSYIGEGSINHDDLMDSSTQALLWLSRNWLAMNATNDKSSDNVRYMKNTNPYAS